MKTFIALLRGINVGGKNIVKMADLKRVFESIGLYNVKTYIQSGNILFKSNEVEELLEMKIEHEIKSIYGFSVKVVLRTADELDKIISNCPFSKEKISEAESLSDAECLYVALLTHAPLQEKIMLLSTYRDESNEFNIVGREVFLLFQNSIRNSKLANNLHKLDVTYTVRNWITINKLAALAKVMDS